MNQCGLNYIAEKYYVNICHVQILATAIDLTRYSSIKYRVAPHNDGKLFT